MQDLSSVVKRTGAFLGKSFSESELEQLLHHLSFESMKGNPYVNYDEITEYLTNIHGQGRRTHFIRKGKVGSWREELSPDSIRKLDEWIGRNKIQGLWDDIL